MSYHSERRHRRGAFLFRPWSKSYGILYAAAPSSQVLVYLPSGPVLQDIHDDEERVVEALAASSDCTVVRINYRLSSEHTYPTPIHDVFLGYDWIMENMLDDQPRARLGVCGELVGASLATTLALTECELHGRRIHSAAINNPIADWVFPDDLPAPPSFLLPEPNAPDETNFPAEEDMMTWWTKQEEQQQQEDASPQKPQQKRKRAPKPPPPTSWIKNSENPDLPSLTLSGERDVLFHMPEHYFDRFASPIHFFRSPHGKLIYPKSDDFLASSSSPSEIPRDPLDIETRMDISHYESFSQSNPSGPQTPLLVRCRAYARVYPPAGTNLSLPKWHITAGKQSPLLDQTAELAKMIKRSIARQTLRKRAARVHWQDPDEKKTYEKYADERVEVVNEDGTGLWTMGHYVPGGLARVERVGSWMRAALRGD